MAQKTLTAKAVWTLPPPATGQRFYSDKLLGKGFALKVTAKGRRSFVLIYRPRAGPRQGKQVHWKLGDLTKDFGLGEARQKARDALHRIAHENADPAAEKGIARTDSTSAQATPPVTYREAVEDYINRYQIGVKQNGTFREVRRILLKEGSGWLDRPITAIATEEIWSMLERIRDGDVPANLKPRPYLANRTYAHLKTFWSWASSKRGLRGLSENPMLGLNERPWAGEKPRERVLQHNEIGRIWNAARDFDAVRGAYLKLILLTGKRKSQLRSMKWIEVDQYGVWTPEQTWRKSNKRRHAIPLPERAVRTLRTLPRLAGNPFVFASSRTSGAIEPGSAFQSAVQQKSGVKDFFWHATKHAIETRLSQLGIPYHVRDIALDHSISRGAGKDYDHHQALAEVHEAFEVWSRYISIVKNRCTMEGCRPYLEALEMSRRGDRENALLNELRQALRGTRPEWAQFLRERRRDGASTLDP